MNYIYNYSVEPHSYLAEEILLGYIIINPHSLKYIMQDIEQESFFFESHKIIYRHLNEIYQKSTFNLIKFVSFLEVKKSLKRIGHLPKIIELIKQSHIFTSSINNIFYLKQLIIIVNEYYIKRLIIKYAYRIINLGYNEKISSKELYLKSLHKIEYIYTKIYQKNLDNLQTFIGHSVKEIQKEQVGPPTFNRFTYSGFKSLDKIIRGLPHGDLIVIAGRPSMGKTSLAINIAYHVLQNYNNKICFFSLEMNKRQILHKLVAVGSEIPIVDIIKGKITRKQWQIVQQVCKKLLESDIYINDTANISIEEIIKILEPVYKDTNNKTLLIIDYLQLIQTYHLNNNNRSEELSYITRKLKILAQNLYIPVIILSQLNRNIDTRSNKKPLLSDLRESGCLSCRSFIHIQYINQVNILDTFFSIQYQILYIKNSTCIYNFSRSFMYNFNCTEKYNLFKEEVFTCLFYYKEKALITDTHPILINNNWSKQCILEQNDTAISQTVVSVKINTIEKHPNIFILTHGKDLVYEISRHEYLNFLYFFTILHNSIEQDADIVIMLYCNNSVVQASSSKKVIDLTVSKNRNGSIGSLQLLFKCPSTVFKDVNKE